MSQIKNQELIKRIALQLKKIREEKQYSQEVVFFDTGIHIGRIEQGKQNITVSTLAQLCNYYNLSLLEFFVQIEL